MCLTLMQMFMQKARIRNNNINFSFEKKKQKTCRFVYLYPIQYVENKNTIPKKKTKSTKLFILQYIEVGRYIKPQETC